MGSHGRVNYELELEHKCIHCDEEFRALSFYTSTDRIHGEETKYLRAKCEVCGEWGEYPLVRTYKRSVVSPPLPKFDPDRGTADRLVKFHRPADLEQVLAEEKRLKELAQEEE